jgi:hypothetical protein
MPTKAAPFNFFEASPEGRFAAVYRVLSDAIAARAFPGCAFGVLAGGEVVLLDALGHFTYDEAFSAVAAQTVYDVASLTKVVSTTAAAMLLYQRGQLDLETPLGELLPGFVVGSRSRGTRSLRDAAASAGAQFRTAWATWSSFAPPTRPPRFIAPALNCPSKPNPVRAPSTPILASFCSARRSKLLTARVPRNLGPAAKSFSRLELSSHGILPFALAQSARQFRQQKRIRLFAIAAFRAKCRTNTPGCSKALPAMPGFSPMSLTCCGSPARF